MSNFTWRKSATEDILQRVRKSFSGYDDKVAQSMPFIRLFFMLCLSKLKLQHLCLMSRYRHLPQLEVNTEYFNKIRFFYSPPNQSLMTFVLIVTTPGTCKEGWTSFQRSCYLLSTSTTTWSRAEEQCRSHGGHLVVLNNVEELVRFTFTPVWSMCFELKQKITCCYVFTPRTTFQK